MVVISVRSAGATATASAPASRYASIVLDAETGSVLYERNADLPRFPASLTKIMTLYLTFEALTSKKIALTDLITMSAHAVGRDPSRLDLAPGSKITLEDAIRAMTTKSANDAACAVGETLGKGSEQAFAKAMTAKARALGLTNTTFLNASGLPEDGHQTSARDLALLCVALIRDYPDYYHYFSMGAFKFNGTRYPNQNRFLRTYYGADGIKTGFINASGHNLAASAVRGGKRLIAVVLGGDTQAWTREHATRLLDISFAKVDPSLVMIASSATGSAAASTTDVAAATRPPQPATPVATTAPAAPAATTAPVATAPATASASVRYPTPAGAATIASGALPLPNATANLNAFAASTSAPKVSANKLPAAPAPAVAVAAPKPVQASPAAPAPKPAVAATAPAPAAVAAAPSGERQPQAPATEAEVSRMLLARAEPAHVEPVATRAPSKPAPASAAPAKAAAATSVVEPKPVEAPAKSGAIEESEAAPSTSGEDWSVQVGLFRDATVARRRGEEARSQMPLQLRGADLVVARAGDGVHIASRISRLSEQDAREACTQLQRDRVPCVVVPPGRPLVVATN